uniref:Uncharacterized protein n=1 Tax=Cucumis sativus TaxID=3659 RepID=A0A0A0L3R0_CUCSA
MGSCEAAVVAMSMAKRALEGGFVGETLRKFACAHAIVLAPAAARKNRRGFVIQQVNQPLQLPLLSPASAKHLRATKQSFSPICLHKKLVRRLKPYTLTSADCPLSHQSLEISSSVPGDNSGPGNRRTLGVSG